MIQYLVHDALANVLCPACKLWNTGHGANMMREAVSLMGGYGITEDCPGFLGHKWMDAQLEATYEGPEAVQRRQLSVTMTDDLFLAQFKQWIREILDKTSLKEDDVAEYSGEIKDIKPVTVATYQILTYRPDKKEDFPHFKLFDERDWGLIIYDEVHLLPAPVFRQSAHDA